MLVLFTVRCCFNSQGIVIISIIKPLSFQCQTYAYIITTNKVPHRGNLPGTGVICSEISPPIILACHSTEHEIIMESTQQLIEWRYNSPSVISFQKSVIQMYDRSHVGQTVRQVLPIYPTALGVVGKYHYCEKYHFRDFSWHIIERSRDHTTRFGVSIRELNVAFEAGRVSSNCQKSGLS